MKKSAVFDKLASQEDSFFKSQFLSPVVKKQPICVRVSGVVVSLLVSQPKDFQGWGVFRALDYKKAAFVRNPELSEKSQYLQLFPVIHLILCRKENDCWYGMLAHHSDSRFRVSGLVPVSLAEEVQLFEVVLARFDGNHCWFDTIDLRHNPVNAIYLRESLQKLLDPKKLTQNGLTQEERYAYQTAYSIALDADKEAKKNNSEEKLKNALKRAGARYRSHIERNNSFTIEFSVNGENMRSVVSKDRLEVQSAGICLSGGDKAFDLQSLVGVIREGQQHHRIVRVGLDGEYR